MTLRTFRTLIAGIMILAGTMVISPTIQVDSTQGKLSLSFGPNAASAALNCTGAPDSSPSSGIYFGDARATHDYCYSGAPGLYRYQCDDNFDVDLGAACDNWCNAQLWYLINKGTIYASCRADAAAYAATVRQLGWQYFGGPCYLNQPYYGDGGPCGPGPECGVGNPCRLALAELTSAYTRD